MTPQASVFQAAIGWIEAILLGPVGTSLAVIAVASVGFLMLSGRINLKRGATVILGCFILFGASSIAHGLRGLAAGSAPEAPRAQAGRAPEAPPDLVPASPPPPTDPYAGAALRR